MDLPLPTVADLPEEFAVFPLPGALLLPRGKLPLNIFEARYLALTEDSLAAGRLFGMIQPDSSLPDGPSGPALFRVGCLGRLSSFAETEDGRYLVTLTGMVRFRVTEEVAMRRGYRRVRGDFSDWMIDLDPAPHPVGVARDALLAALRAYFSVQGFEANWEAIGQMPDEALVSTLCMACPFDPSEKQALLEALTPTRRAEALLALLRMGAHSDRSQSGGRAPS